MRKYVGHFPPPAAAEEVSRSESNRMFHLMSGPLSLGSPAPRPASFQPVKPRRMPLLKLSPDTFPKANTANANTEIVQSKEVDKKNQPLYNQCLI